MQYLCLRDCFVHNRFHYEGKTYELAEGENPKNFKPIEEKVEESTTENLTCSVCGKECKSFLGLQSHMRKHKEVDNVSTSEKDS